MDDSHHRPVLSDKHLSFPPEPPRRSSRGLDWFVFFIADVQTGFGPFVAVYLTANKWTQADIGLVLTAGGLVSLFGQIPGGALLDRLSSPRRAAAISTALIGISALILALSPTYLGVFSSRIIQAAASCVLGPAIAALGLGLARPGGAGQRFGRNAAFASIGTGLAAGIMGLCGYYISNQSVFFVTALLVIPALISLYQISESDIDTMRAHGGPRQKLSGIGDAFRFISNHKAIFVFALCVFLFYLANAAVLPIIAGNFTRRSSTTATLLIAIAMIVPQLIVAIVSPLVGRGTQSFGRRRFLLFGFAALFVRILATGFATDQIAIVALQAFDGISAAIMGVLVPLTVADLTRNTGHFNLVQGLIGCFMGLGASFSTTIAGFLADRFSTSTALLGLSAIAGIGFAIAWMAMPETGDGETKR